MTDGGSIDRAGLYQAFRLSPVLRARAGRFGYMYYSGYTISIIYFFPRAIFFTLSSLLLPQLFLRQFVALAGRRA